MAGKSHALILTEIKNSLTKTGEITNVVTISSLLEIPKKEDMPHDSEVK
jgi:hypothetical protein